MENGADGYDISEDYMENLRNAFSNIDSSGDGYIETDELQHALEICGFKLPMYKVRQLVTKFDLDVDGRVNFKEFHKLYNHLKSNDFGANLHLLVKPRENVLTHNSSAASAADDVKHSVRLEEQIAFSDWINKNLCNDPDCQKYLPLNTSSGDLYERCKDGILLCKVINKSMPDCIDERAINKGNLSIFRKSENIVLALNSARSIGCAVINIDSGDILNGIKHLILGLLWQIIKVGLLSEVNLGAHSELAALLFENETLEDLKRLSPEQILLRWVNYHLSHTNCDRRVTNFGEDIRDSVVYAHLLHQICPPDVMLMHPAIAIVGRNDLEQRAEAVLENAEKMNARVFVQAGDIVAANYKLNLAFVANLFQKYPALEKPLDTYDGAVFEESREERTYRNWMNSMMVRPYVNHLYTDLRDGLVIFQLFDFIKKDLVDWKRVNKEFKNLRANFLRLENCNYAVELGHSVKFSLVGVGGKDLLDGNVTLTLALVWQLMRAYTLAVLSALANQGKPVNEAGIVEWANRRLQGAHKSMKITSFKDATIANSHAILNLLEVLRPGIVNFNLVYEGVTEQERVDNAKLALALARKAGAAVYALHDDIIEVKPKMVMTIFACLMMLDRNSTTGGAGDTV